MNLKVCAPMCTHTHTYTHMLALLNADYYVPGTHISTLYILNNINPQFKFLIVGYMRGASKLTWLAPLKAV